jgi:tetratricopeptide (TPR) repeat protein
LVSALLLVCLLVQGAADPTRPALPGRADRNDWQAYFDRGADLLRRYPNQADSLFYWAHRLDPSRAEPLFARWVAFWLKDIGRFERYLDEDPRVLESPEVLAVDTLYLRALQRNPFVPRSLLVWLFNQLPGSWDDSPVTRGWLAYSKQQYTLAASYFGQMTRANNDRYVWMHSARALAFLPQGAYDSASVEMGALLAKLRTLADTTPSHSYESLEMVHYAIGLLQLARGHADSARRSFERAVEENLAFFPAHAELGELALGRFNRTVAERDFKQAAELAPTEAWIQCRLGTALLRMGKPADALAPLERAIALEPWYAEAYLMLGKAWDGAGDRDAAVKAFQQFLERAPRRDTAAVNQARLRVAALGQPR